MRQKSETRATPEQIVKDIRGATRKHHSAEEKIRMCWKGLRGEYSIAELCRREGIAESLYYSSSKEFLEAGKKRLAGDTVRAAAGRSILDCHPEYVIATNSTPLLEKKPNSFVPIFRWARREGVLPVLIKVIAVLFAMFLCKTSNIS